MKYLQTSADQENASAIIHLLGVLDSGQKLAEAQIGDGSIQQIVRHEPWILTEPVQSGSCSYARISDIVLPKDLEWDSPPPEDVTDRACREQTSLIFPHPKLLEKAGEIFEQTASLYDISTKVPSQEELAFLAETAIRKTSKEKRLSGWWNNLYRWLGSLGLGYEVLVGKRLIWTQSGIEKVTNESRIFSPPRRLIRAADEESPMMSRFQEILIGRLPEALQSRVAFLHPEVDLTDKLIRDFLIRSGRTNLVVREFRTDQVASFVLNDVCKALYRKDMSKKRRRDATELFAWCFVLWRHMRGEGFSIEWSHLLVPTTIGFQPASETYAGRAWNGEAGADMERIYRDVQPAMPFLVHPQNLLSMLPKDYQDLISKYNLQDDLKQFVLGQLNIWTAPPLKVLNASKAGGFLPEFCPIGGNSSLDTSVLKSIPEVHGLPISGALWDEYLSKLEEESKNRPFKIVCRYVLSEVAYIDEVNVARREAIAFARCLARGWNKYYSSHAKAYFKRHPNERGDPCNWSVSSYVVEQLRKTKWVPVQVWSTRIENGQKKSGTYWAIVKPERVAKVSKDLLGPGSALYHGLIPHIAPDVESYFTESLCREIGTVIYSPRAREVQNPLHIMRLIASFHEHLPAGREHLLLSVWQELFDAAASSLQGFTEGTPDAALGFEIMETGERSWCWLRPEGQSGSALKPSAVWINDNDDCLSLLPSGTFIVFSGKNKGRMDYRADLLKNIMRGTDVRRLSELQMVPDHNMVDGWEEPRLLSDVFPWLVQPALALLAFGRQTSQHMSVSNPKGEFQTLATRLQDARIQYVSDLLIRLDGLEMESEGRVIFYISSKNLLLIDNDVDLRLRDLANPLSLLFGKDDYLTAAQLWLMKVEEATENTLLRFDVSPEICIKSLGIESNYLHEVFQVLGGVTQQIITSVAPALFACVKRGKSPFSAQQFNRIVEEVGEGGNPFDYAEKVMIEILGKAGLPDVERFAQILRQVAEQRRDSVETAKRTCELADIELGEWNTAAFDIGSFGKVIRNQGAVETFNRALQDTRWAACGFLQSNLKGDNKEKFLEKWESFDCLTASESIHDVWQPTSAQIEKPIVNWFETQATAMNVDLNVPSRDGLLESIRARYAGLANDPDAVLDGNVKVLAVQWQQFRVSVTCLVIRGPDSETILSHLRNMTDEALRKWAASEEALQSIFRVAICTSQELFATLRRWCSCQPLPVRKILDSIQAATVEEFISANNISTKEQAEAETRLRREQPVQKEMIAKKTVEIPEKDKPLDDLRKNLDGLLSENNQELLKMLSANVDVSLFTTLGAAPAPRSKPKPLTKKSIVRKSKEPEFTGFVGEYLIFRALKRRYTHIGLSDWVSGNKQRFFPGSTGNDDLGYDFSISVDGRRSLIEVKTHKGDQPYFELGSSEVIAAQDAIRTGEVYQVWVIRNLQSSIEIDRIPNPMAFENRRHLRLEVGRVYYRTQ